MLKKVISIFLLILVCFTLTGCGETIRYNGEEYKVLLLKNKISYKEYITLDKKLVVIVSNENDIPLSITIDANLYDEDDNIVGEAFGDSSYIPPKSMQIVYMSTYISDFDDMQVSDYNINTTYYKDAREDIDVNDSIDSSNINLTIENTSDITMNYLEVGVSFYYENTLVGFVNKLYLNYPGKKVDEISLAIPEVENEETGDTTTLVYDDYEVEVISAYTS